MAKRLAAGRVWRDHQGSFVEPAHRWRSYLNE